MDAAEGVGMGDGPSVEPLRGRRDRDHEAADQRSGEERLRPRAD